MEDSAKRASDIGNGRIVYNTAYAKYQYEGVDFNYTKVPHPQATHHWFETAKARWLDHWGTGVAKILCGIWMRAK